VAAALVAGWMVAALEMGCAASPTEDDATDAATTTSAGGSTGGGGQHAGAAGGGAGQGGSDNLCGTDCTKIGAPACHRSVCNEGLYPGPVGACTVVPVEDGESCDDGEFCTLADSCQAGLCTGGPANDCGMTAPLCQEITCDETSDNCTTQPGPDGGACVDPTNLCIQGATCLAGQCAGGTMEDCFFAPVPDDCHVAVCNPIDGMCAPIPGNQGDPCIDINDLCTVNKTCNLGVCSSGTPKDCSQLTMGCDLGVCDTTSGQCTTQTVMNGQLCDDLDACTNGETCNMGTCGMGTPVTLCSQTSDGCCPSTCTALDDIDCACMAGSLTTPFVGGNSQDGNMFDVVALKNIEVQGVSVSIGTQSGTIEVYYRPGTHVGFESSSAGWTLAGSAAVVGAGTNTPTPVPLSLSIQIPSGQTYALYVTLLSGSMNYTNGTAVGTVLAQNPDLQILEGIGKDYPFLSTYTPRYWNGVLHYTACGD
jgi:hypothetical protein